MGDRANVAVQSDGKRVYFYTHSSGYCLPETVRAALARNLRWDDSSYLARIIFCEMVRDCERGETGFGISPEPTDNEYPFLVVNINDQTVTIEADDREGFTYCKPKGEVKTLSFAEYAALPAAHWATLDTGRAHAD